MDPRAPNRFTHDSDFTRLNEGLTSIPYLPFNLACCLRQIPLISNIRRVRPRHFRWNYYYLEVEPRLCPAIHLGTDPTSTFFLFYSVLLFSVSLQCFSAQERIESSLQVVCTRDLSSGVDRACLISRSVDNVESTCVCVCAYSHHHLDLAPDPSLWISTPPVPARTGPSACDTSTFRHQHRRNPGLCVNILRADCCERGQDEPDLGVSAFKRASYEQQQLAPGSAALHCDLD